MVKVAIKRKTWLSKHAKKGFCMNTGRTHFKKGSIPWNKGITHRDETIKKIKKARAKQVITKKHKKAISTGLKKAYKERRRINRVSSETKQKIRKSLMGNIPWNKGMRRDILMKHYKNGYKGTFKKGVIPWSKGRKGKNSPCWRGGLSFEPYSVDWTKTLKRSIRERDKYACQACGKEPSIQVHHIDYNKKNCNPNNLITLCVSCHIRTNFNRENWIKYFEDKA